MGVLAPSTSRSLGGVGSIPTSSRGQTLARLSGFSSPSGALPGSLTGTGAATAYPFDPDPYTPLPAASAAQQSNLEEGGLRSSSYGPSPSATDSFIDDPSRWNRPPSPWGGSQSGLMPDSPVSQAFSNPDQWSPIPSVFTPELPPGGLEDLYSQDAFADSSPPAVAAGHPSHSGATASTPVAPDLGGSLPADLQGGADRPASQGGTAIGSAAAVPVSLSERFEHEILPALHAGTMSLQAASTALGRNRNYLQMKMHIDDGVYDGRHSLFGQMSADGKRMLNEYIERERKNAEGYRNYAAYGTARTNRLRRKERQSEGSSEPSEVLAIGTPGLDFQDFYVQGTESQAGESSTPASQQPHRRLTYPPSPSFFEGAFDNLVSGSSSVMAAPSSLTELRSTERGVRQGQPGADQTQGDVLISDPSPWSRPPSPWGGNQAAGSANASLPSGAPGAAPQSRGSASRPPRPQRTRSSASKLSASEKRRIYLKLLPDYEEGKIARHALAGRVGITTANLPFSVPEGAFNESASILEGATPDEMAFIRQVADRMHQEYKRSGMSLSEWSSNRRRKSSKQQSRASTNTNEASTIRTPGLDFEGVDGEGTAPRAGGSSGAASHQTVEMSSAGFVGGLPGTASQSGTAIASAAADSLSLSERFENEILPALDAGTMSLSSGSLALGKNRNYLQKNINIDKGTYNADRSLFKNMSQEGRSMLNAYIERTRKKADGYTTFAGYRSAERNRRRVEKWQPEGSSGPSEVPAIDTPGLDFGDVYREGIESQAGDSPASGSRQPGQPMYGPSPTFFDGAFDNLAVGSSSPAVAPSRPTELPSGAPPVLEPLSDREVRVLYEGLTHVNRPLRSVSDVASWLAMENQVERVRPYVSDVETQGEMQLQLTDLGKRVLREKGLGLDFGEPGKRARHALIKRPTPAEVRLIRPEMRKLRIDEGQDERAMSHSDPRASRSGA